MSMGEYMSWKALATLGAGCWLIIPFVNIKFFGIGILGYAVFLLFIGLFFGIINKTYLTYRLGYIFSVLTMMVLCVLLNVIATMFWIIPAMLMMACFVFIMAYIENTASSIN